MDKGSVVYLLFLVWSIVALALMGYITFDLGRTPAGSTSEERKKRSDLLMRSLSLWGLAGGGPLIVLTSEDKMEALHFLVFLVIFGLASRAYVVDLHHTFHVIEAVKKERSFLRARRRLEFILILSLLGCFVTAFKMIPYLRNS